MTVPHAVLGTAPYMSPEQARGAPVDFRSDLFSFGSILYEMLTGRRAFERATSIETLTAILHDEPLPVQGRNGAVPPPLLWVLQRCLAKAAADRYAATADLYQDLRTLRAHFPDIAAAPAPVSIRKRWVMPVIGIAAMAVVITAAALALQKPQPELAAYRFLPLAAEETYAGSAAWSPDGRTIAYVAQRDGVMQVMTRGLEASRPVPITSSVSDCRSPFWSADGTRVYYIRRAGDAESLYSVASTGGTPQLEIQNVTAATISPTSGAIVFLREEVGPGGYFQALWRTEPALAEPARFATGWIGSGVLGIGFLRFSPDGRTLALWGNPTTDTHEGSTFDSPEVWLFSYPDGRARRVLASLGQMSRPHPFAWMPDNRRLVFGADLVGASPGTHLWMGDITTNVLEPIVVSSTNSYEPDVSRDGQRIVFSTTASHYDLVELPLDGSPAKVRLATSRDETDPSWSATGSQFAYVTDRSGPQEIWLSSADGSLERPAVTAGAFQDGDTYLLSRVAFAPDGRRLAYQRRNRDGYFIWLSTTEGGPAVQPIPRELASYQDAPAWSPDGEWIAFIYGQSAGRFYLGKMRPGLTAHITPLGEDVNYPANPAWSPDGRWISCEFADGLYVVSADGRERRRVAGWLGLRHTWARDSSSIIAIRQNDDDRLELVSIDVATTAERVLNADLGPAPPATPPVRGFTLSNDGRRVLTSVIRLRGELHLLEGFAGDPGWWRRITQNFFMSSPRLNPPGRR